MTFFCKKVCYVTIPRYLCIRKRSGSGQSRTSFLGVPSLCLRSGFAFGGEEKRETGTGHSLPSLGYLSKKAVRTRRGGGASGSLSTSSLLDNAVGDIPALQLDTQQIVAYRQAREVEVVGVGEACHKATCVVEHFNLL